MTFRHWLAAPAALLLALPAVAQLSPAETRMVATVDAEADRHIELLERLVNQNSGTLNVEGVKIVGDMMRAEFDAIGLETEWIDMSDAGRSGHLVATHEGGDGPNMLLIGHLDTVFEPSSPFQTFVRDGDSAAGPGVADNKDGITVILAALRAMRAAGTLADANIKVVLTGDEERAGEPLAISRRDLYAAGDWADIALGFEGVSRGPDGTEYGVVARRSSSSWTLTVSAKSGHSSRVFSNASGYGAIYELARILDDFREQLIEPNATFNVGVVGGGTPATLDADELRIASEGKTNISAETAIARGDLRTLTPEQDLRLREKMQEIVATPLN
ncbi:MAG: M20/M25/M40 family metallo-hydrolase, partial [Pacificimonas sp.]